MKRFLPPALFAAILAGLALPNVAWCEDDPPPDDTSTNDTGGWLMLDTFAPGGTGSVDDLPDILESLGDSTNALALPLTQPPLAAGQDAVREPLYTGLTTTITPVSNELIAETVRALDCDWRQCYLFVRNQIHFMPYRGIMRGPERTFLDREGNDADQAFLLRAMLRACGYTNAGEVAVLYLNPPGDLTISGFRIPLGGTASGYDAASWLGVSSDGNTTNTFAAVNRVLGPCALAAYQAYGPSIDQSYLLIEHYWVRLTTGGKTYDLDPSFKPCRVTPPSSTTTNDMQYSQAALLAAAGGTNGDTGDKYSVKNISTTGLVAKLNWYCGNLAAAWRATGTNVPASDFVGRRQIVVQDPTVDAATFHGVINGIVIDFLSDFFEETQNGFRTSVQLVHGNLCVTNWMDECAARHLWLSYATATGYTYPKAVLHVDDTVIATEPTGSSVSNLNVQLIVIFPGTGLAYGYPSLVTRTSQHTYSSFVRNTANVFAIPVSVGDVKNDGMRLRALRELDRLRAAGRPDSDVTLRSRVLQVAGQQWMEQTALADEFESSLLGMGKCTFFRVGVSGQKTAPFYDIANIAFRQTNTCANLDVGVLLGSALEHAVWDQLNGANRPSVSTVRIMDLANTAGLSIFVATSNNYTSVVRSKLTNYTTALLNQFKTNTDAGLWLLLPRDGQIALKSWKGYGYVLNGPTSDRSGIISGLMIDGGLSGGLGTSAGATSPGDASYILNDSTRQPGNVASQNYADPVDTCSGAATLDRTDLALAGPSALALARHYDARQRHADGPFGRGWAQNWDRQMVVHADPDARLGKSTPAACVPAAVACVIAQDLLQAETNARNVTVACLVAKWWTDQLVEGTANVRADGQTIDFQRSPDGSYTPAPGITATLATNGTGFVLQTRLGNTTTFGTSGMVTRVQDPSGNSIDAYYHNASNDYLVAISNSFGQALAFAWTWNGSTGRVSSVTDSAGRTVSYRYSPTGCLTGVTDAAGFIWNYAYDSDNNLVSETDPDGIVTLRNACNSFGQVTNQVAANGQSTRFAFANGVSSWDLSPLGGFTTSAFDTDGRLQQRITPDGCTNAIFYDSQGQILTNLDALGRVTVRAYDASNNLVSVTEAANTPNARTTAFGYDSQFHLVAVTNALGRVTRMTYDACHRLTSRVTPDGTTVTNTYETHGLPAATIVLDAAGHQLVASTFGYSSLGFATNVTSTDSGSVSFRHDNAGNPTNIIDALGRTTRLFYDPRGLLTNTTDATGNRVLRSYTSAGRLASVVNPLNRTNTLVWTASGQPAATRFANGGQITNEYDIADRLVAVKDARGTRVQLGLDVMGRTTNRATAAWSAYSWFRPDGCVTTTVDVVGGRTDIGYDGLSRPVAVVDPLNRLWQTGCDSLNGVTNSVDARSRVTNYGLDLMGRRIGVTYPSGRTEGFAHDALGRMTAFTNSEGHVYRLGYDGQGRIIAATNAADEQVFRNFFDPCGNLTNRLDGAGRSVRNQFDVLNHCTNTVYADGSNEAFTFDAVGNLLTAQNAATTNIFGYNSMNYLTSAVSRVAGIAFTNLYRYDLGGLATNVVYPGGKTVQYVFDADGRVANVTDWNGHTWQISRDAAGRMTGLSYPNGVSGAFGYDASHAVTSWSYSGSDTNLPGRSISRNAMGLKTNEVITSGRMPKPATNRRAVNTFDAADRLTSALVGAGTNRITETYLHDGCGALTNVTQSGNGVPPLAFTYDLAGRMISATTSNLSLLASYDALGNRVQTTINGTTHLWVIDHTDPLKRPLMETDTNGAPVRYYVWGARRLLAVIDADGTTRYAHSDEQGSVVALTDASGGVLFTASYGPYGEPWGTTGTNSTPFGWLGGHGVFHADGSSLYLTRHRAYDTTLKRFLSPDPMGLGGGANLYGYAKGNPMAFIDPLGLCGDPIQDTGNSFAGGNNFLNSAQQYVPALDNSWKTYLSADYSTFHPSEPAEGPSGLAAWTPILGNYQRADASVQNGNYGEVAFYIGMVGVDVATLGTDSFFENLGVNSVKQVAFSAIGSTGKVGEQWLANNLGGESQVFFNTSQGGRFIDQLASGVANESKVGYTSLTPNINLQIAKDAELLSGRAIEGVNWHFFTSPVTGKGGPSQALYNALMQNNINVIVH